LCECKNWEGALAIESEVTDAAVAYERTYPPNAGAIYDDIGRAHRALRREGGIEKAIVVCYTKK
jgi:hypothetical protein